LTIIIAVLSQILVYEALVRDLNDIIANLIIYLDCKDREFAASSLQDRPEVTLGATTDLIAATAAVGRHKVKQEETAIAE
jgi:hypothetical protein